jgi:hypothetical protein
MSTHACNRFCNDDDRLHFVQRNLNIDLCDSKDPELSAKKFIVALETSIPHYDKSSYQSYDSSL